MDLKNAIILILGLLAMVFLFSSQVSARDLTETSSNTKKAVVEKKTEAISGYEGYVGIGYGFPGNNARYFEGYPVIGGRYMGRNPYGYPYYANGFPFRFDGHYGGFPGIGVEYRGNPRGFNSGYGGDYPGGIGGYNGGRYIGSHSGDAVEVKNKDNTHN